jgi:hypothetical protein
MVQSCGQLASRRPKSLEIGLREVRERGSHRPHVWSVRTEFDGVSNNGVRRVRLRWLIGVASVRDNCVPS